MFVVVNLYGVQQRLHTEKRTVRQTLSRELFRVRFIGGLHQMRRRIRIEKRGVRGQGEKADRFLSARQDAERRPVLLYFKITRLLSEKTPRSKRVAAFFLYLLFLRRFDDRRVGVQSLGNFHPNDARHFRGDFDHADGHLNRNFSHHGGFGRHFHR